MRRKKRKHVAIPNESLRKATLGRRRDCLFKKAKELSTLCDVEVGVIVQDQEMNDDCVWPSHHAVEEKLVRFLNIPEVDRNRKMSTHESFLSGRVSKIIEYTGKIHQKNDEKEGEYLMHELIKGKITIKELDMMQINGLIQLMLDKMNKFERRIVELDMLEEQGNQSLPTANPHFPSLGQMLGPNKAIGDRDSGMNATFLAPYLIENYKNDQRFSGYGSNAITPGKSLIDDFNNDQWLFDSQRNSNIPNLKWIEDMKNGKWLTEMMFDKQSNSLPSCASDMGHYHTNAGNNEGNNLSNDKSAGSTSRANHMDFTPQNEVADPSVGIYDGFPKVEWPYIFLPDEINNQLIASRIVRPFSMNSSI